ncbi:MAG: uridine kinase [Candidatus Rokubacteria bacterium]|nr:uridine kinase [Candidatus Rokubacteria bacterium]
MVGVTGGSGSGKSTLVRLVADELGREHTSVLCHDAYYRDRSDLDETERAALDFDVPDALDGLRFRDDLARLRRGERVCPPRYCFVTHRRDGDADAVEPRTFVLVDGILLLHDPAVRALLDLAIFVDAPSLLRLRRRLARDTIERGRASASVLRQYAETVMPAHVRYVEPTKTLADVVLKNTGRLEPLVEVAAALIRARRAGREEVRTGARLLA